MKRRLLIVLTGLVLLVLVDYLGFFAPVDSSFYDLFFRLRGPRTPNSNIIIAAVDERTLRELGRWPLPREDYAALLDRTNRAAAVGFDLLFTEPSDDDAVLARAVARHGRVVLPVYIDTALRVEYPVSPLTGYRLGHIHVTPGIDGIIRKVFHTVYIRDAAFPSFSSALYETATGAAPRERRTRAPAARPSSAIQQRDAMNINFYGVPGTFPLLSMADILTGVYPPEYFNGKTVLVGLTAPGITDTMLTPFSQGRNRSAGVEIHAAALNNLLDGRAIKQVNDWVGRAAALALSFFWFFLCVRCSERWAALAWLAGLLMVPVASFMIFATFCRWVGPALFGFTLTYVFVLAYVMRLDQAARELDARYSNIITLIRRTGEELPPVAPAQGLASFLSTGGINARIQTLLKTEALYDDKLQAVIDEKTHELSRALSLIHDMSRESVLRLTVAGEFKDKFTGQHIARIGLYARRLATELGLPHDIIERIASASPMHDIGKIGIPDQILLKPGPLDPDEQQVMRSHTIIGSQILAGSIHPMLQMATTIALYHHEKWNGAGYPQNLKENEIPLEARVIMICDVYDALRSRRPYKEAYDHKDTLRIIQEGDDKTSPRDYDPDILKIFLKIAAIFDEVFEKHRD